MANTYNLNKMKVPPMTDEQELDWIDEIDNITDTLENVKRELNRKLMLAKKYGYDEYASELAILLEKMDMFRKMGS